MSDDTVLTPITPEDGVAAPPKVTPSISGDATTAPTLKLKPVIRKPLIRKPVIGGAKPVTLKPASGTPPPPAAVPEAAAEASAPSEPAAAAPAEEAAAPKLKAITSPIAAQATLRKTGIVAEGILTPAQAQAAKTKTSRISLESAVGVAPSVKSAAPMKTIRLRRPTDLPPAGNVIKPAVNISKPAESAPAASAPVEPIAPVSASPVPPAAPEAAEPVVSAAPVADLSPAETEIKEPSSTVTQKKTLKLRRPNFKRPTVGGLRKPGAAPAEDAAPVDSAADQVPGLDAVADLPAADDVLDIKNIPAIADLPSAESNTVAGAPAWLNAFTIVAGIAALIVAGLCTWSLYTQASGPDAGPNGLASFYSETDHSR